VAYLDDVFIYDIRKCNLGQNADYWANVCLVSKARISVKDFYKFQEDTETAEL